MSAEVAPDRPPHHPTHHPTHRRSDEFLDPGTGATAATAATDAVLLSSYQRTAEDYQRLQDVVRALHPLFEGFVVRTNEPSSGPVIAPYVRVPETGYVSVETAQTLGVALVTFAHRFRPDLDNTSSTWAFCEVAVGFYPTYLARFPAHPLPSERGADLPMVLEDHESGAVMHKGTLGTGLTPDA